MDFKLNTRRADSVFIVDLAGKITAGEALTALRQTIRDEVAKGHTKILLNLKDVSYIDSSGLGELIMALGTVTQMICAKCGATVFRDDDGNWDACPQCESREKGLGTVETEQSRPSGDRPSSVHEVVHRI